MDDSVFLFMSAGTYTYYMYINNYIVINIFLKENCVLWVFKNTINLNENCKVTGWYYEPHKNEPNK